MGKSAKINFDSAQREWRGDVLKWRYLVFADNSEHIEWRRRLRSADLSASDIALCRRAVVRWQQIEHLVLARRTGPDVMAKLIGELEANVLRVLYVWFEELVENGEEIAMGRGWSFNRYEEQHMLSAVKAKQIPIEFFKLPLHSAHSDSDARRMEEQPFVYKSH